MGAGIGALLMQGAGMIGDFVSRKYDMDRAEAGQRKANQQNIDLAREQMRFQRDMSTSAEAFSREMSSTAYTRKVADLRAAGLNPALAYESGGASSPTGVTAGGATARVDNTAASALAAKQIWESIKSAQVIREQTQAKTGAEIRQLDALTAKTRQEIQNMQQTKEFEGVKQPFHVRAMELQNIITELGITGAENEQELEKKIKDLKLPGNAKTWIQVIRSIFRPR